jgi:hypothetical protein
MCVAYVAAVYAPINVLVVLVLVVLVTVFVVMVVVVSVVVVITWNLYDVLPAWTLQMNETIAQGYTASR